MALMLLVALLSAPDTETIVARLMEADQRHFLALRESTCLRKYRMESPRFRKTAEMNVQVKYAFPGEKSYVVISETGPRAVRSQVFRRMLETERINAKGQAHDEARISPGNYTFEFIRTDLLDGRQSYVLRCEPKTKNPYLFRGEIWVDAEDSAVAKIEGTPARKPSLWIRRTRFVHRYSKVGQFWVAASNVSESDILVFGRTTVSIDYSDYRISESSLPAGSGRTN